MVEKHDIMLEILRKLNTFDPIRDPETSDIILILLSMVLRCPRNYHNDYNVLSDMCYSIFGEKNRETDK